MQGLGVLLAAVVVLAFVFGPLSGWLAIRRRRGPVVWFIYGAVLGPIAVLLLLLAPPGACPRCDEPVRGWPSRCPTCGSELPPSLDIRRSFMPATRLASGQVRARLQPSLRRRQMAVPITAPDGRSGQPQPNEVVARPALTLVAPEVSDATRPLARARPPISRSKAGAVRQASGRPGAAIRQAAEATEAEELAILASGVFVAGTEGLAPGLRYTLGRHGDRIRILGPVDVSPQAVCLEWDLDGVEATVFGERLVLSRPGTGLQRGTRLMAFHALAGMDAETLKARLASNGR